MLTHYIFGKINDYLTWKKTSLIKTSFPDAKILTHLDILIWLSTLEGEQRTVATADVGIELLHQHVVFFRVGKHYGYRYSNHPFGYGWIALKV